MTTTTREAALEAAAKNLVWAAQTSGGTAGRDEGLVAACDRMEAALSTPATEPQGYAEVTEEMVTAGRIAADDKYYKWRGLGTREEGQGLDGMHFIVREAINKALAARPAPQPAADTRVVTVKPLVWESIGGNFYRTPGLLFGSIRIEKWGKWFEVVWSVPGVCDTLVPGNFNSLELAQAAAQDHYAAAILSAIIGNASPAPSDKIAEAAQDKTAAELVIDAYDAANPFRQADMHPALCHCNRCAIDWLRALAGKGE